MTFASKTVMITGAAQGIGAAAARWFSDRGASRLLLLDRDSAALRALADELGAVENPPEVERCEIDISCRESMATQLRSRLQGLESLQVLVNSAGIADENEPEDEDTWHRILDVNLHGTYYASLEALRWMPNGGRIINVSSLLGRAGKIRNTAYCTSKHAMLGFTKSLALDLASRRITVNAVLPGWVDTPMLQRELQAQAELIGTEPERLTRNARKQIPLKRFIDAQEVASLIGFLASDEASGITAQSFIIDGGFTCGV